jgi:hypothetical protein
VWLDIRTLCAKEGFCPLYCECFDDVDEFTATVVASPGIALRVLVGEYGSLRHENCLANEVLRGNEFDVVLLAKQLAVQGFGDFWVGTSQVCHTNLPRSVLRYCTTDSRQSIRHASMQ